jgi:hypothetical protein
MPMLCLPWANAVWSRFDACMVFIVRRRKCVFAVDDDRDSTMEEAAVVLRASRFRETATLIT